MAKKKKIEKCSHRWVECEKVIKPDWGLCPAGGRVCLKCNTVLLEGIIRSN